MNTAATTASEQTIVHSDLDPYSDEFLSSPLRFYEELREAGPVVWLNRWNVWCVARYAEVSSVLKDWRTYCSGAGVGLLNFNHEERWRPPSLLLENDPPNHTRLRTVMSRVLSPANIRKLRETFERTAVKVVETALQTGPLDAFTQISEAYILNVFPNAVGIVDPERKHLMVYGDMAFNSFGPRNDRFLKSAENQTEVVGWIMQNCERDRLTDDGFGSEIYAAFERGEITSEEALYLTRSFLSAGVDTTIYTLTSALYSLAVNPLEWNKLSVNRSRARDAVEEVIRWQTPFHTFFRTTTRETDLSGTRIEADTKVMLMIASANRDPRRWSQADVFNLDRRTSGQVGFGAGIHGCVGQMIAKLEMEVMLQVLADRVARIELTGQPTILLHNALKGFAKLPLQLVGKKG